MIRYLTAAILLTGTGSLLAVEEGPDFTSLPPELAELEQQLAAASLDLNQAIAAIEKQTGGIVAGIEAIVEDAAVSRYEALAFVKGMEVRATVNAKTGAVTVASIPLAKAIEVALAGGHGSVRSAFLDTRSMPPRAIVVHYDGGKGFRTVVNASTGDVLEREDVGRFPGEPIQGEWVETPSGLKYYDIRVGEGPSPGNEQYQVTVHYTGWLVDGTKFDSSVDRGQPARFPLNGVIPGWREGVLSMKVGGKRKLILPYELAYGENGNGRTIPPKATLIFDVELMEVAEPQQAPAAPRR